MGKKTHVYPYHQKHGNIVEYAGYDLPVWYEGIIAECHNVREHAGVFDVSHMGRVIVEGPESAQFLDHMTTNNVSGLTISKGHYSILCNPHGGIIDDITVFRLGQSKYLVVYNAGNREKNWKWLTQHLPKYKRVKMTDVSGSVAMFAVQGPMSSQILRSIARADLEDIERYASMDVKVEGRIQCLVTRTGYTGEDGFEIYVWNTTVDMPTDALNVWDSIIDKGRSLGLHPAGLGARDVLRLEAGMCLYGNDIGEDTSPVEAKLMFVTDLNKSIFIGRDVIAEQKSKGPKRVRVGFKVTGKGIPRKDQEILDEDAPIGTVTSGTLSPTLGDRIGMGYVDPSFAVNGKVINVNIRDREVPATIIRMPFYQRRSADRVVVYGREMGLKEYKKARVATVQGQAIAR